MATFTVSTLLGYYVEIAEYSGEWGFDITIYRSCEEKDRARFLDIVIPARISGRRCNLYVQLRTLKLRKGPESHPSIRCTYIWEYRQEAMNHAYAMIHAWESYLLKKNQEY